MLRAAIIAIVAVFTLGLVGCAPGGQIEPAPEASSTEGESGAPDEGAPDEESSEPDSGDLAKAGSQKVKTDDGLEIWITDLKRGRVGSDAVGGHPGTLWSCSGCTSRTGQATRSTAMSSP